MQGTADPTHIGSFIACWEDLNSLPSWAVFRLDLQNQGYGDVRSTVPSPQDLYEIASIPIPWGSK